MGSNLSNHQLKIDCYLHTMLYINLMVTINQKPITEREKQIPYANTYLWNKKKGSKELRGRTGIKMQM